MPATLPRQPGQAPREPGLSDFSTPNPKVRIDQKVTEIDIHIARSRRRQLAAERKGDDRTVAIQQHVTNRLIDERNTIRKARPNQ